MSIWFSQTPYPRQIAALALILIFALGAGPLENFVCWETDACSGEEAASAACSGILSASGPLTSASRAASDPNSEDPSSCVCQCHIAKIAAPLIRFDCVLDPPAQTYPFPANDPVYEEPSYKIDQPPQLYA